MFEEFRINRILKKTIDKKIYIKLPNTIKNDKRILQHFIKCDPENINVIDEDIDILEYVLADYSLIKYLSNAQLNKIFKKIDYSKITIDLEFFNKLVEDNKMIIFKMYPDKCINFFSLDQKINIILEIIYANLYNKKSEFLNLLSDKELINIIFDLTSDKLIYLLGTFEFFKKYLGDNLYQVSIDRIYNLYNNCPEILEYLPQSFIDLISMKEATGNIGKILNLHSSNKVQMALKNPKLLLLLNGNEKEEYIKLSGTITCDIAYYFKDNALLTDIFHMSEEEQFKFISSKFLEMYYYYQYSGENYYKIQQIMFRRFDQIEDKGKVEKLRKLYLSLTPEPFVKNNDYIYYNETFQISKLLFDHNIVNNNSVELIEKYKNTKDRNILIEILSNAYGKHVKDIFENRPNLNIENLESFSIFNRNIYEVLGVNFINFVITYSLPNCNYFIYEMSKDKDLLVSFKKYFLMVSDDYDNINVNFIYNLMDKFIIYKSILRNINYDNISDNLRQNIKSLINDSAITAIYINSEEDIENYNDKRRQAYADYIDCIGDVKALKNIIFSYVTNREIPYDGDGYLIEKLSIYSFLKSFNIQFILENEEFIQNIGLNKDDISILLLLNKIKDISNVEVLKDSFKAIVSTNLDYSIAKTTIEKIKKYCSDSVKNNILSRDKLDQMASEKQEGVEIINLDSEPFSALISITGLNISSGIIDFNSPFGESLLDDWLHRENGYSHISTALVSSDTSIYPMDKNLYSKRNDHIAFIFDSDIDIQGMGTSDISSSHQTRSLHYFDFIMYNDFGYLPFDEFKRRLNNKVKTGLDFGKFDSEISISRFKEDIRKEDSGSRVLPIGIYVVGEVTKEIIETAKAFNDYYEKHNLGRFRIIRVNPKSYKGKGIISKINEGEKTNEHNR